MNIIKTFTQKPLAEICQQKQVKFAFAKDCPEGINQLHQYVLCRDFLNEVLQSNTDGKSYEIYGFFYDRNKNGQLAEEYTGFLYSIPNQELMDNFKENLQILHEIEAANDLQLTTVTDVDKSTVYLKGDKFWQQTCYRTSLYTLLLRCFVYKITQVKWIEELIEKNSTNETSYLKRIGAEKLYKLLTNLQATPVAKDNPSGSATPKIETGTLHNYSGIVSAMTMKYGVFSGALEELTA